VSGDHDRGGAARLPDTLEDAVVAGNGKVTPAVFFGNYHSHHPDFKKPLDAPLGDFLIAIDLKTRVFVAEIVIEFGQKLIAARDFIGIDFRKRKDELLPKITPEKVFNESHGVRIRTEHFLSLLDLLAILFGYVFQALGEVWLGHCCVLLLLLRNDAAL